MAVNGMSNSKHDKIFGLMNQEGKYLTAEKFGNQISVTGTSLRAKQLWAFEPEGEGSSKGYLRSPQNNYLETTKTGTVTCESDEKQPSFLFDVSISDDGRWAFKDSFGKYLAGNTERLYTTMDSKQEDEFLWAIHIAAHPQCNMFNISRKRYVHLRDDELRANEDIPWGHDAVITVEFNKGKYALRDSQGRYLDGVAGTLVDKCQKECLFVISLHDNEYAFKGNNGKYLTAYGPTGKLIAHRENAGRDELFALEESKAQVILTANNGKKASIRQGIDVTANQFMEPGDSETFQVDYHQGKSNKTTFVAKNKKFWIASSKSVTAAGEKVSPESVFEVEWKDEKVALKAFNGKYIMSSSGGQLAPTSDNTEDLNTLFIVELVNRPILVLRSEHGYIGFTNVNDKVQCNRGAYDAMQVENENGKYRLKASNGKSWKIDGTGALIMVDGEGELFLFELCGKNKMKIKASNGQYLKGDHNGAITASGVADDRSIVWEY